MNSFNFDHSSMEETHESNAITPDTRLRSTVKAFRTIDLCIALFFLLWVIMFRLPFAVRILGELLRRLLPLLLTPLMISLLFGVCIATVMVQSYYRLSAQNITDDNNVGKRTNFYENTVNVGELHSTTAFHLRQQEVEEVRPYKVEDKVVYEDKEIIMSSDCDQHKKTPFSDSDVGNELGVVEDIKNQPIMEDNDGGGGGFVSEKQCSSPRDVLNDADFKKSIDAFIKKQRDFLKLENRYD